MKDRLGGEMPVPKGARVLVSHRDGELHICEAGDEEGYAYDWKHTDVDGDIIAYIEAPTIWKKQ